MNEQWWSVGRWAAWVGAACFLVSSVIALLIFYGVTAPASPDLAPGMDLVAFAAEALQWKRDIWLEGLTGDLFLAAGALTLVPLGLALRQILGADGVKQQLLVASFSVGAAWVVGGLLAAAGITRLAVASAADPDLPPAALPMLDIMEVGGRAALSWLSAGFLFLFGIGVLLTSRAALEQRVFSRGWAWMGIALASASLLTAVALVTVFGPATMVRRAAVGVVLAPLWGAWLGVQLGRQPASESEATSGVSI